MREVLPVLLGFCFGGLTTGFAAHSRRAALTAGSIGCIALAAVFTSGEFHLSWTYLLLDLVEAAAGFAAGCAVAWRWRISVAHK